MNIKPRNRKRYKLKIDAYNMREEDREMIKKMFLHLKELHQVSKKAPKDLRVLLQNEIRFLRSDLTNNLAHKFFVAQISLGPHKIEETFPYYPGYGEYGRTDEIVNMKNELLKGLQSKRQGNKETKHIMRSFNGMNYAMVGGEDAKLKPIFVGPPKPMLLPSLKGGGRVFEKNGAILNLLTSGEYANRITRAKHPYDKSNYVGVEIEMVSTASREVLNKMFVDAKLAGSVYILRDGSIRTEKDTDQPNEITLIAKQQNSNETISRVCDVLNSDSIKAYVNNSCGLHVHLDMRNRDPKICYTNLFYSLPILAAMVPSDRLNNEYCRLNTSPEFGAGGGSNRGSRYSAINCEAYTKHSTIEIRLHSGSLNKTKINNWVNLLVAIGERKDALKTHVKTPEEMAMYFGIDQKLVEYIKTRMTKFKDRSVDTRKDHFEAVV